jgi:osmotically-inducible protein OsmY
MLSMPTRYNLLAMKSYTKILVLLLAIPLLHGCFFVAAGAVVAGASVVHDRREASTVVDDRKLQLAATDAINKDKDLVKGNYRVKIVVYDNVMLICGQTSSAELKERAQSIAAGVGSVKRVVNEIEVIDEPEGFWHRREDNTLTARVKTALLNITSVPGFDPTRINVTTSHDVVYLMGLISHEEDQAVTEVVSEVSGVAKVVKMFEYTD